MRSALRCTSLAATAAVLYGLGVRGFHHRHFDLFLAVVLGLAVLDRRRVRRDRGGPLRGVAENPQTGEATNLVARIRPLRRAGSARLDCKHSVRRHRPPGADAEGRRGRSQHRDVGLRPRCRRRFKALPEQYSLPSSGCASVECRPMAGAARGHRVESASSTEETLKALVALLVGFMASHGGRRPPSPPRRQTNPAALAPVNLFEYEPLARQRLYQMAYDYIAGEAANEITLRGNRRVLRRPPPEAPRPRRCQRARHAPGALRAAVRLPDPDCADGQSSTRPP